MAGPTGFPLNQSTYIPGGPLVINGTAVGSNNLISFQLNGSEVANLNQSGVLSTAGGGGIASFGAFGSTPNCGWRLGGRFCGDAAAGGRDASWWGNHCARRRLLE